MIKMNTPNCHNTDRTEIFMGRFLISVIMASLLLLSTPEVRAAGVANARALGMAGSYTGLASGVDCPLFNPANLGFQSHQQTGLQIVGAGLAISNNSFSLDDYNTYTGATLNEQDKQDLLDKIPDEGLELSIDAEVSALSLSMGNMAVSVTKRTYGTAFTGQYYRRYYHSRWDVWCRLCRGGG